MTLSLEYGRQQKCLLQFLLTITVLDMGSMFARIYQREDINIYSHTVHEADGI